MYYCVARIASIIAAQIITYMQKEKIYHTTGAAPKSNSKNRRKRKKDTPNPYIHDYPLSLLDTTKKPMFKGYQRPH